MYYFNQIVSFKTGSEKQCTRKRKLHEENNILFKICGKVWVDMVGRFEPQYITS